MTSVDKELANKITAELEIIIKEFNFSPIEKSISILDKLFQLAKVQRLTTYQVISYSLLLCLNDKWKIAHDVINQYKSSLDKESYVLLSNMIKKFKNEPFCSIYAELNSLQNYSDESVSKIAETFIDIYEERQAEFLSKVYTSVSQKDLIRQLAPLYSSSSISSYLSKYGFVSQDQFIILRKVTIQNSFLNQMLDNFQFLNRNTIDLENIVKSNPSTIYIQEQDN